MGKYTANVFLMVSKKRTTLGWLFFLIALFVSRGKNINIFRALPIIFIGLFLRLFAAGTIKKNEVVTRSGPYRLCRHPLYLGSFFISVGFLIASNSWVLFFFFLLFFPSAYLPTIFSEEKFLSNKFGEEYLSYQKEVPAFFPNRIKIGLREKFSFKQAVLNKEYWNIVAVILTLTFLLIKANFIF